MEAALVLVVLVTAQAASVASDDPLVDAIAAANTSWLRDTEFRSTYKKYTGTARSLEEGLRGRIINRTLQSHGVFHKSGPLVRYSVHFEVPPKDVSPRGDGTQIAFGPNDASASEDIQINLTDRPDVKKASMAMVSVRPERFETLPIPGLAWRGDSIGPFSMVGGVYRGLLDLHPAGSTVGSDESIHARARELGDGLAEVVVSNDDSRPTITKRLLFDMTSLPPVNTKVEWTERDARNERVVARIVTEASDFVDCPGGRVPRMIRNVSSLDNVIRVTEWISNDLGTQHPTDADFRVDIPAYCRIVGLESAPPTGSIRSLSPAEIKASELMIPREPEPLLAPTGFPDRLSRPSWGAIGLGTVVVMLIVAYMVHRRGA